MATPVLGLNDRTKHYKDLAISSNRPVLCNLFKPNPIDCEFNEVSGDVLLSFLGYQCLSGSDSPNVALGKIVAANG